MSVIQGDDGDNTLIGRDGDDSIYGGAGNDLLAGRGGNDTLNGESGGDTLVGGAGDDVLSAFRFGATDDHAYADRADGGAGDDYITGSSNDTLLGEAGDDYLVVEDAANGRYEGGAGIDYLVVNFTDAFSGSLSGLSNSNGAVVDGSVLSGFERGQLYFRVGDNVVDLGDSSGKFTVSGGAGDDHLIGRGGNDTLFGGVSGIDTLDGGGGDDVLEDDNYSLTDHPQGQLLRGGGGNDALTIYYERGTLMGGSGRDTLSGAGELDGGSGDDLLRPAAFGNLLKGGAGMDTYLFINPGDETKAAQQIVDDTIGSVDLHRIDADKTVKENQDFRIVDAFDGQAGELVIRYDASDGQTHVEGDVDGDGAAELNILIKGDHTDPGLFVL